MNENKKILVLLSAIVLIIILIVAGSFYENKKSREYLSEFHSALNGDDNALVMIGRDNCSWCQLFHPSLDFMHEQYGFDYLYVNTNELTSSGLKLLLKDINVSEDDFGTPLTIVVKDGEIVDSLNGFTDEEDLLEFLKEYNLVDDSAKLFLNYIDYKGYEKLLKSKDTSILVIGQTTCSYCMKAKPILNQIVVDKNVKINYINVNILEADDRSKFNTSLDYLQENEWGTPLTLILKDGEVIASSNGLLDYDGYVKLFEDNGLIK